MKNLMTKEGLLLLYGNDTLSLFREKRERVYGY